MRLAEEDVVSESTAADLPALREARRMNRHQLQAVLFAERPSRLALLALGDEDFEGVAPSASPLRINVWRNHAIEPVLSLMRPYAAWAGLLPEWRLGDYDDTLQFAGLSRESTEADIELLWLDLGRYAGASDWLPWLASRLQALRSRSAAPIVLVAWAGKATSALRAEVDKIPGARYADLDAFAAGAGLPLLSPRTASASGTPVAAALHAPIARALVCHWIAACVRPAVKALAIDLDHTLHCGVLGEDGVAGVVLTPGHAALQSALGRLRARGVMLALVSRNEAADAQAVFEQRDDYPLRWSDFSATEVSWQPKADAIERIARRFNIATDSIVFVDDNPGELWAVAQALPQTRSVLADADAALTWRVIEHLPGLWRWVVGVDDAVRVADLSANAERAALRQLTADPAAYFRQLQVTLHIEVDAPQRVDRLAELSAKTNQFNLAVRRLRHADIASLMQSSNGHVVAIRMSDVLADSGVVGMLAVQWSGNTLEVIELCISCRAMGRGLEDAMVLAALQGLGRYALADRVRFLAVAAPRNQPAREWIATLAIETQAADLDEGARAAGAAREYSLDAERLRRLAMPAGLTITYGDLVE